MASLYSHDIILVLFSWIIKKDYKNKNPLAADWGQPSYKNDYGIREKRVGAMILTFSWYKKY